MRRTPDEAVVQFSPGNTLATTWWVNSSSTSPARLGTGSALRDGHRLGRLQAIPKKASVIPGTPVTNDPGGRVPVLSCGEGIQTNTRTGIGSPAFRGNHTNDFFSTERFNYEKLLRRPPYCGSSPRRLGNWILLRKVPQLREAVSERDVISTNLFDHPSWDRSSR